MKSVIWFLAAVSVKGHGAVTDTFQVNSPPFEHEDELFEWVETVQREFPQAESARIRVTPLLSVAARKWLHASNPEVYVKRWHGGRLDPIMMRLKREQIRRGEIPKDIFE